MTEAVIVSACRTPIGKYGRALKGVEAVKLGSTAIAEAVKRAGIPGGDIDEVIMGSVIQAGLGQNPARQAALHAGLPDAVAAFTVNKVCASGLKAVSLAADAIKAGSEEVIVAGGMESMSRAPHLVRDARWGVGMGNPPLVDAMVYDGLWDVYNEFHMGMTGEVVSERHHVTREDQDRFALESHRRAAKAISEGRFKAEIVPVAIPGQAAFDTDEGVRADASLEKLAKLPAAFKQGGVVTAGNASQLSDGGAALVVMSDKAAERHGVKPIARIVACATGGVKPEWVMEAPIPTVQKLLKRTGFTIDDFDLIEHNEAFAAASVAVMKGLGIKHERLNVNGGAVALGHPLGCSGARILTTLLYAMRDRGAKRGLATLCLGGGNAMAMIVERM